MIPVKKQATHAGKFSSNLNSFVKTERQNPLLCKRRKYPSSADKKKKNLVGGNARAYWDVGLSTRHKPHALLQPGVNSAHYKDEGYGYDDLTGCKQNQCNVAATFCGYFWSISMSTNSTSSTGTQGGTHEQHVKAGQQSHKNDDSKSGSSKSAASNDSHGGSASKSGSSGSNSGSGSKSGSGSNSGKH